MATYDGTPHYATPNHIAIIMDGNGRWAKQRKLPRIAGHKKGAESIRKMLESCRDHGVNYLTLYAFSSENWQRSEEEVGGLMSLLRTYLKKELKGFHKEGIKLLVIGEREKLDADIQQSIADAEALTADNDKLTLLIALSYGSHQEIARAAQIISEKVANGSLDSHSITPQTISDHLYTASIPAPDLLIRTGGEIRLSNFLLWQSAYTELLFSDVLWPEFGKEQMNEAIAEFSRRERRYGTA